MVMYLVCQPQRAKKVVSVTPGLVDFAIGLMIFVLNLPDRQVLFFGKIQITEGLYRVSQKFVPLFSCTITFDQNFIFT